MRPMIYGEIMELIEKGAEAELYLTNFNDLYFDLDEEEKVIVKHRLPKSYRIKNIDDMLREKRTISEARIIHKVKESGVNSPHIYEVDLEEFKIIMEYIEGIRMKDYLNNTLDTEICKRIGRIVGKMHDFGVIHGDLTTSNMIKSEDEIYLIDFGLSRFSDSLEEKGVDLHLLRQAMESAHWQIYEKGFENILEGYRSVVGDLEDIKRKIEEIEGRGRYK